RCGRHAGSRLRTIAGSGALEAGDRAPDGSVAMARVEGCGQFTKSLDHRTGVRYRYVMDTEADSTESPGCFRTIVASLADLVPDVEGGLTDATAAQREEAAVVLAGAIGRVEAFLADALGAVDAHGDWLADGARSVRTFISSRTELSSGHVGAAANMARDLRDLPVIFDAWRSGRLGTAKVRMVLGT